MKSNIKIKTKRKRNNHSLKQLNSLSIFLSKIFKKNLYFQLKTKFSTEFFDWLYNKNPNGRAIINNIYENNKIVAHFALVPVKVLYKKKIYKSALSVFTAVDKNNRGLYYFHKIATKSLQIAKSKGIRFVIGVSNEASAKIFINVLNFKLISPLDVKIGLSNFNEWKNSKHNFEVLKDKKTLNWRLKNPRFNYQIIREKEKFIIFNNNYKLFKINMGNFSLNNKISKNNFKIINTNNLNPINMWIGINNKLKNNFKSLNLPNMLKPSALNLIIKDLKSKKTSIFKKDIKFNLIDFEIF